ncbi:MAG: hypothetical protein OSB25_10730 [Salibacteraceae bacterium]|nr:hypothetical protein [Salibacteraceae bacterium]
MSRRKMLIYSKTILRKVSFDARLFQKELKKAMSTLSEHEAKELKHWVLRNFYQQGAPLLLA